jgi:hypothetical protein
VSTNFTSITALCLYHHPVAHENAQSPSKAHDRGHHHAVEADSSHEAKASDAGAHYQGMEDDHGELEGVPETHHDLCRHYWRT